MAAPGVSGVRKAVLSSVLMLPLLTGCLPGNDPIAPELKGRWAAPNASKLRSGLTADRLQTTPAAVKDDTSCREQYVTFDRKYGVAVYMNQMINPLFKVTDVKRDGQRLILSGSSPISGAEQSKLEIIVRNGEVRFDDVIDQRGRSIKYERIDTEQARRAGISNIGDIFRLVLDLKPCSAWGRS
jgi:hypothetical protein